MFNPKLSRNWGIFKCAACKSFLWLQRCVDSLVGCKLSHLPVLTATSFFSGSGAARLTLSQTLGSAAPGGLILFLLSLEAGDGKNLCCSKICMCLPCRKLCVIPCAGEPATGGLGMWAVCSFISKGMSCLASEKLAFHWVTLNMTLIFLFFFFPACVGDVPVRIRHTSHDAWRFKSTVKRDWACLGFNEQLVEVIWLSII